LFFAKFLDAQGILDFLDHEATVNADCYCTTLQLLKEAIRMKCPGLLRGSMFLPLYSPSDCSFWSSFAGSSLNLAHSDFVSSAEKQFKRKTISDAMTR
jgi:hypothetical protein